ncbi:MAG TPA: UvrD-helicase domain-containing protein [Bryobacteraceae bacterium]|nr:UvrD-helicase domain-containing protein [Bryobacteraceae bacterium]
MSSVTDTVLSDEAQRRQAIDPSRSVIVEAPAGSGKTSLLVQRFLRLLSAVDRPECVVAMTFTRKAAAEMRERVLSVLETAEQDAPLENRHEQATRALAREALRNANACGWDLLSNGNRLQIQTIDSFCYMLVRQMPVTSGLGGVANVADNPDDLYRVAARRTLRELTDRDEASRALFRRIALHVDNNMARLETQIVRMLGKRDQWRVPAGALHDERINDFCILHERACEMLLGVFREHGQVDFCEITNAAIQALGSPEHPTDLLYWLDYKIEHLLVDEFQDTSRRQYRLLQALTEQWSDGDGHTLFLVGDPMQSIYRFREAEVSLFLQCCERKQLGSVRLTPVRLTSNFRSTPEVVDWTQSTFAPIMCEDDPSCGAVKLRPVRAARPSSTSVPRLIPLTGDSGEAEAQAIVEILRRAPVKNDVAILVRSRSQVAAILPALRAAGILYEAIDFDSLKEEQHVLDLVSLTRALLHLGDRLSWLACLRAPWCGLALSDLAVLAEADGNRTIFDLLSDPEKIAALSPDGRPRAVRVQEIFGAAIEWVGRVPLRGLVEKTWFALGGPAVWSQANYLDDAETFFALIEDCEQGGIIRDFGLLNERLQCLWAKPAKGEGAVQVLTIHNAKGLEFKTVILPKLGAKTNPPDRDLLVWTERLEEDGTASLLIAAKPQAGVEDEAYRRICEHLDQREAHELKRLFYVATTRAKDDLYLLGNANPKRNGEFGSVDKRTFLGLIWDSVKDQFETELRLKPALKGPSAADQEKSSMPVVRRLPGNWRPVVLEHSVHWEPACERTTASSSKPTYRWVSDIGRHVGTVTHDVLKRIAADGLSVWNAERLSRTGAVIRSELARLGVRPSDQDLAFTHVMRAIGNTLHSEKGRWILQSHPEARSEWALEGRIGNQLIAGTVDRVFRDDDGRLWIVDFKTSEHQGADLQGFVDREQARYTPQLQNYGTLVSQLKSGPIYLGLYFPLLDEWREWAFEDEATLTAGHYTND